MVRLNFRSKLLLGITSIIFIIFFVLTLTFYNYYSNESLKNELLILNHSNERLNNQIDELFNQMSMSGLYITKTEFLHDILNKFYTTTNMPDHEAIEYYGQLRAQMNILTYYFPNASNVVIFNSRKNFHFQTGLPGSKERIKDNLRDLEWYDNLIPAPNTIRILPPHQDFWVSVKRPVISIIRNIETNSNNDYGLLEFDIPYWNLEKICNNNIRNNTQVFIFDENDRLIFPYKDSSNFQRLLDFYSPRELYNQIKNSSDTGTINIEEQSHTYSYKDSEFTDWTTLLVHYPESLEKSKQLFLIFFSFFAIILLTVIIIAFFILIKALTRPLYDLMHNLSEVNIDNMNLDFMSNEVNELTMLSTTFNTMLTELKLSINKVYESKLRETNARFLALQAQINPHFIHNTLSVISASAERSGITETTIICDKLSKMLRYTSGSTSDLVPLLDEINHVINYIELIQLHYTDYDCPSTTYLTYDIRLPVEMEQLLIPKMILQPLVENSINHGFKDTMPPWHIDIICNYTSNNDWSIVLHDNGCGFDETILKDLTLKIETYANNLLDGKLAKNSEIGGMGIMNTFSRLKIQYPNSFEMILYNSKNQGACYKLHVLNKEVTHD